jgi:hypothetical protein
MDEDENDMIARDLRKYYVEQELYEPSHRQRKTRILDFIKKSPSSSAA